MILHNIFLDGTKDDSSDDKKTEGGASEEEQADEDVVQDGDDDVLEDGDENLDVVVDEEDGNANGLFIRILHG